MSNRPQEKSYFMTPDSLRAYLHLMEQLYNSHTSVNMGKENADGTQYSGTIENFGSEILMEASKMKLRKPPLNSLIVPSIAKYYFDIQYAEYIDTYDQQYMMCAMLRDNVIYNTWEYILTFSDLEIEYVVRSESSSDPVVRCDAFYVTETPPILSIEDDEGNVNTYEIEITDSNYISAKYYFPINALTNTMHDSVVDGTMTIDLKRHKIVNAPYIWFCVPTYRHLPYINMTGNVDYSGAKLLTIGNNGHDIPFMFPCIQSDHNVPSSTEIEGYQWYLKVFADFQEIRNNNYNYTIKIIKIEYIYSSPETLMTATPEFIQEIEYDDRYTKLVLAEGITWRFHTPVPGDYDYDGETYNNPCYAYIPLSGFESNSAHENLIPAFRVIFDEKRYIESSLDVHTNEIRMNHCVTGAHIDFGTDYAEHAIYKEKGLIHELSEFDGLPTYLSDWMKKETHRGHVELYTICDNLTKNTPMNRQTAAIIVDTAVPPNDMSDITMDLPVMIKYQGEGIYETIGESPSPVNYLSELGYYDWSLFPNTVGVPGHPEYKDLTKFIYHGNGVFSLQPIDLDPALQYGRVYLISNDPASYDNNEITENAKAGRTMARICDIPTSYIQIISVEGHSPTYALDPYYVRQYASLTDNVSYEYVEDDAITSKYQNDLDVIWNEMTPDIINYKVANYFYPIFASPTQLNNSVSQYYMETEYAHYTSLNEYLDMSNMSNPTTFTLTINDGGAGYAEHDTFNMLIGGVNFKGTVTSVDSGVVQSVSFENGYEINQGNIPTNPYLCKTTTTSGSGDGLRLNLEIDSDEWTRLKRHTDGILPNRYALVQEAYNYIWIYKWDDESHQFKNYKQFTGYPYEFNAYDDWRYFVAESFSNYPDQNMRTLNDVIIFNALQEFYHDDIEELKPSHESKMINNFVGDYTSSVDYSEKLSERHNYQETYSYISGDGSNVYDEWYHMLPINDIIEYPEFHRGNTYTINTSTCGLTPVFAENKQPFVFYYNAGNEDFETITDIMDGVSLISSRKLTFKDIFPSTIFSGNNLACNTYSYSFWNDVKGYDARREELDSKTYDELIAILEEMYGECEPVNVAGSIDQYPIEKLKDYIMQRELLDPGYYHEDTKLLRGKGEQVVEYIGTQVAPVGEQPHGGFIDITNERRDPFVYINHHQFNSNPSYVFRLDGDIPSLDGFKMYDSEGRDISENCILIVNYVPFVYINSVWVQISTQNN
jgi:hypothetical protein